MSDTAENAAWHVEYEGHTLTLTWPEYRALWRATYDDPAEAKRLSDEYLTRVISPEASDQP